MFKLAPKRIRAMLSMLLDSPKAILALDCEVTMGAEREAHCDGDALCDLDSLRFCCLRMDCLAEMVT